MLLGALLVSCGPAPDKAQMDKVEDTHWTRVNTPGYLPYLYRYIDQETGVVVYMTSRNGDLTSQKIGVTK